MIKSFRSKDLQRFWERGDERGIRPDWRGRIKRQLFALHADSRIEMIDLPGYALHRLTGDQKGRYSILVSRNWRITFMFEDGDMFDIDLEDYHGH